eukprot:2228817-Rhodomonas_salina.2
MVENRAANEKHLPKVLAVSETQLQHWARTYRQVAPPERAASFPELLKSQWRTKTQAQKNKTLNTAIDNSYCRRTAIGQPTGYPGLYELESAYKIYYCGSNVHAIPVTIKPSQPRNSPTLLESRQHAFEIVHIGLNQSTARPLTMSRQSNRWDEIARLLLFLTAASLLTASAAQDCDGGFGGPDCEACTVDSFTGQCNVTCDRYETCSGNGRCLGRTGKCVCDDEENATFYGADCSRICPVGFGGPDCNACDESSVTEACNATCNRYETCGGHGRCHGRTGACICDDGVAMHG